MTHKGKKGRYTKSRLISKPLSWVLVIAAAAGLIWLSVLLITSSKQQITDAVYPLDYEEYVQKAAEEYNLDEALIFGVIKTESNFNPNAESNAGALGLMQIMPDSFSWLQTIRGVEGTYSDEDLFTPEINIDYGCYLLRYFLDLYGTEQAAVAAYNAGFVVGDWLDDPAYSADGVTLDYIPYPETSAYVKKVQSAKEKYNELYFSK